MSDQPDQSEKTEEASSKKLEEAHKKGDVAKSQEVSAWFGLIGITIIVVLLAGPMAGQLAAPLSRFIVQPHAFAVDGSTLLQIAQQLGLLVVAALALPMLVVIVAAIALSTSSRAVRPSPLRASRVARVLHAVFVARLHLSC